MTATFRLGFKNVLGARWTLMRHRWPTRAGLLARELTAAGSSVWFLVEVNGRAERRSLDLLLPDWQVARSRRGHNDAYSDPQHHRIIDHRELPLGTFTRQQRYVTLTRYIHLASGVEWSAAVTHLSSSAHTTAQKAERSRELQARRLVELCQEHAIDVVAGDLNNLAVRPDTPRGILQQAGYSDWRSLVPVRHGDYDVHHRLGSPLTRHGRHLDAIYVAPRVAVLDGQVLIDQPDSSDHLGLACTLSIPGDPGSFIPPRTHDRH